MAEQATVGVREAAEILGCSPRRIRRMVKAGRLRADLLPGKWGAEYRIERQSLPDSLPTMSAGGEASPRGGPAVEVLAALLRDTQERLEAASALAGQLGAERDLRRELEARARSLVEAEAAEKARAESLAIEGERLRSSLRLRTWALAIALAGVLVAIATAALR